MALCPGDEGVWREGVGWRGGSGIRLGQSPHDRAKGAGHKAGRSWTLAMWGGEAHMCRHGGARLAVWKAISEVLWLEDLFEGSEISLRVGQSRRGDTLDFWTVWVLLS